jgi:hypothetical protein
MKQQSTEQTDNQYIVGWEKWHDPYGDNIDEIEWPGYDKLPLNEEKDEYLETEAKRYDPLGSLQEPKLSRPVQFIATAMGLVPMTEYSTPSKVFNFWTGNTNFDITTSILKILNEIAGVETLTIFTRYRFRIGVGKMFKPRDVMHNIDKAVAAHFNKRKY